MKKIFHILLPWLFAALWCALFLVTLTISHTFFPVSFKEETPKEQRARASHVRIPGFHSASDAIINRLSFTPDTSIVEADVPLVFSVIENHEDARPAQQGLHDAIAVFEFIVEGDITRFLAVFRGDQLPENIGPVRSLREFMVSVALGYHPLLLHIGGHPLAYAMLRANPKLVDHDGIRFDGETFQRDPEGRAPHNLFMPQAALQSLIEKTTLQAFHLPLFATSLKPLAPRSSVSEGGSNIPTLQPSSTISLDMGSPMHNVTFTYEPKGRTYRRAVEGAPDQADPKTVVMLETTVEGFRELGYIPWTQTIGTGEMLLFRDGVVMEGIWRREKDEALRFLTIDGSDLPVADGQVWVTWLPDVKMVSWK